MCDDVDVEADQIMVSEMDFTDQAEFLSLRR